MNDVQKIGLGIVMGILLGACVILTWWQGSRISQLEAANQQIVQFLSQFQTATVRKPMPAQATATPNGG